MQTAPLHTLTFHPLVAGLPGLIDEASPQFAALVDDIAERGIDQPLICVPGEAGPLVIDGRNRFRAASLANLDEVPISLRDESETLGIILATLVHRRHYGKGALAYLAYPLTAQQRRGKVGGNGANQHRREQLSIQSTITLDEIAARLGFARDLFYQAAKVHEAFERRPDLRAQFEPRILAGEVGLGACVAGIASSEATTGATRVDRTPFTLIKSTFEALRGRVTRGWEQLDRSVQHAIAEEAAETIAAMPPEVQAAVARTLGAVAKIGRAA
jgi:hypothetical protein